MKVSKMKLLVLSLLLIVNSAFAKDVKVAEIINKAESVMTVVPGQMDLETLQSIALNDNTDVQISYERLVQAQKQIAQARAEYFPYGVGTVMGLYFTNAFSVLILVELVSSLPSKIFTVQKNKHLRTAQKHTLRAVRENIKNQTALIYYSFLKQEALLKLAEIELNLLKQQIEVKNEELSLGLATETDVANSELNFYTLKEAVLKYKSFYLEERKALNILIGRKMDAKPIELAPVRVGNQEFSAVDMSGLESMAVEKSHEIKAANAVIRASKSNRRATKWSIISFSGIGFGYISRVKKSQSQVREAYLRRELLENTIRTSVYTKVSNYKNFVEIYELDSHLYDGTKVMVAGDINEFTVGQRAKGSVLKSARLLLKDLRVLVRTNYDALIKKSDLKRTIPVELITNNNVIELK